jgi:nucleoside-diphosphate-sugar epimerase
MTRALVSGASGFVGANLARRLLRDGHDVHLLLRPGYQPWRIQGIADRVQRHEADITNADDLRRMMQAARPDYVFHLAAFGAYSHQRDLDRMVGTNIVGTARLVDAAVEAGVKAFINAGSSSEYGLRKTAAREDDRLEPNSDYAMTKGAATHYCRHAAVSRDFNAITLRLYSIYGPWEEPTRLMPVLLAHALRGEWPPLTSPTSARDFVYVVDAIEAMLAVAAAPSLPRGSIYNVCSGVQTTLGQVADTVRDLLAVAAEPRWSTMPPRDWDTDCWVGSPDALAGAVGWRATTSLRDGLSRTVDWMRERSETA